MDKLKVFLAVLKKQHFWVLTGLMLLVSTVIWYLAVANIEDEAQKNLSQIQSSMTDVKSVAQITQHPNDEITQSYKEQTTLLKQQIFQVWDELYRRQRTSVLYWPEPLGEDFISYMEETEFGGRIPVDFRDRYLNYVKTRWDELPLIIKAKPEEASKVNSSGIPTTAAPVSTGKALPDWIVIWKDQKDIRRQLFSQEKPTDVWVWSTQEDLWIYANLLNIVAKTNANAIGPHNAIISTITNMQVGKQAAGAAGGKEQRITAGAAAATEESPDEGAGSGPAANSDSLLAGRYIDGVGAPLQNGLDVKKDEFRRVPVRMVFQMDSREIPRLILNCANADLPVEIQQVRVNVTGKSEKKVVSPTLSQEDRNAGRKFPHVEVAMQGVIYIFNPPTREKLKLPPDNTGVTSAEDAFNTAGSGEKPPQNAASAFDETPAETTPEGTTPADEPANADPTATEPAPAEAETAPERAAPAPATTEPKSLESLFEE